jgi:hypothetical protein
VVNCGFHLIDDSWLEQYSSLEDSALRHFRLIARQPPDELQTFTKLEGWNANATVPWRVMRSVFANIVTTFSEHFELRRTPARTGQPWSPWARVECDLWGTCKLKGTHGEEWGAQCDEACRLLNSTEPGCPERLRFLAAELASKPAASKHTRAVATRSRRSDLI